MEKILKGRYRHFKGGLYDVVSVARDCEDSKRMVVVYRALYDSGDFGYGQRWVREAEDFCGYKVLESGEKVKRFEFVGGSSKVRVKVKKLTEEAVLPRYGHDGDAAMDLFSVKSFVIPAGKRDVVPTGIAMELPKGYFSSIRGKSGLALKKGISTLGGVVEYGYTGEYGVILLNTGSEDFEVRAGDKVAQVVIQPVASVEVAEVENLSDSIRGDGAWGSTGGSNI